MDNAIILSVGMARYALAMYVRKISLVGVWSLSVLTEILDSKVKIQSKSRSTQLPIKLPPFTDIIYD